MKRFIVIITFILFQCSKDQTLEPDTVFLISPTNQDNCSSSTIIDESISQVDFSWSQSLNTDQYEIVVENQSNNLQLKKTSLENNIVSSTSNPTFKIPGFDPSISFNFQLL